MAKDLPLQLTGEASTMVTEANTAEALGSGLAPVFATPALVALLEMAAVNAVTPHLGAGNTSVGVHVDVRHLAATPIGLTVRARATLTGIEGRRLTFHVVAHDDREQVGEGTHQRVIVDRERFLHKATAKRFM